jgi:hypothetical protein
MGAVPTRLAQALRRELSIDRAVETGTYQGGGARVLAGIFPRVITIELSEELYRDASVELAALPNIQLLHGDSRELLKDVLTPAEPTFYWLDGHWSGGSTAGAQAECPLLVELDAIRCGHPNDAIVVDDARFITASPPPPHNPDDWPTLVDVIDALRTPTSQRHITLLDDLVIAVPQRARPLVEDYARGRQDTSQQRSRWRFIP